MYCTYNVTFVLMCYLRKEMVSSDSPRRDFRSGEVDAPRQSKHFPRQSHLRHAFKSSQKGLERCHRQEKLDFGRKG